MESAPLPPDGSPPPVTAELSKDEKNLAMLSHLLALTGIFVPIAGGIVGPLVMWLLKRDTMPFVEYHAKEALNFNITFGIAVAVCCITVILIPLAFVLGIPWLVLTIIAALKASEGVTYRYPLSLRLVK